MQKAAGATGFSLFLYDLWHSAARARLLGKRRWRRPACGPANYDFFEPAGNFAPAAPKEKNMKRTISLWLGLPAAAGLLAFALLPAIAEQPTGKIHGHVTNPTGAPQTSGTVTLVGVDRVASGPGLAAQTSEKGAFPVDANGD